MTYTSFIIFTDHDGKMPRLQNVKHCNLSRLTQVKQGFPYVFYQNDTPHTIKPYQGQETVYNYATGQFCTLPGVVKNDWQGKPLPTVKGVNIVK